MSMGGGRGVRGGFDTVRFRSVPLPGAGGATGAA